MPSFFSRAASLLVKNPIAKALTPYLTTTTLKRFGLFSFYAYLFAPAAQSILYTAVNQDSVILAKLAVFLGADVNRSSKIHYGHSLFIDCHSTKMAEFLSSKGARPLIHAIDPRTGVEVSGKKSDLEEMVHLSSYYNFKSDLAIYLLKSRSTQETNNRILIQLLDKGAYDLNEHYKKFIATLIHEGVDVFDKDVVTSLNKFIKRSLRGYGSSSILPILNIIYIRFLNRESRTVAEYEATPHSLECYAARNLNKEAVSKLINENNVNGGTGFDSPLWEAAGTGNLDAVSHILSLPNVACAITVGNSYGAPHDKAAQGINDKKTAILNMLFEKFPAVQVWYNTAATYLGMVKSELNSYSARTLIQHVVASGSKQQLVELLNKATVLQANEQELVFIAIQNGNIGALEVLIEKGCDLNQSYAISHTQVKFPALYYASISSHPDAERMVQMLAAAGANPKIEIVANKNSDLSGETMLHHLARSGNEQAIQRLAAIGADLNAKTYRLLRTSDASNAGKTPLHYAVYNGSAIGVRALLEAGASQLRNNAGQTPRDLVTENTANFREILAALDKADIKSSASFLIAKAANDASENIGLLAKAAVSAPMTTASILATVAMAADTARNLFNKYRPQ